jgi:hypothetical protein
MTFNAFLRNAMKGSAMGLSRMKIAPLTRTARLGAIVVLPSTGLSGACAQDKRVHMNSALQTMNVKTTSIAGMLRLQIVRTTSLLVYHFIVNQTGQYLDGNK